MQAPFVCEGPSPPNVVLCEMSECYQPVHMLLCVPQSQVNRGPSLQTLKIVHVEICKLKAVNKSSQSGALVIKR